jgi:hypothetical protein
MSASDPSTWTSPSWHRDYGDGKLEFDYLQRLALALQAADSEIRVGLELPEPGYLYLNITKATRQVAEVYWHADDDEYAVFLFTTEGEIERYFGTTGDAVAFIVSKLSPEARLLKRNQIAIKDRILTYAMHCPWTDALCFGTSDGSLIFPLPDALKHFPAFDRGPINGLAFAGTFFSASTPDRVSVYRHASFDEATQIIPTFNGTVHDLIATPRGTFVATLGLNGLFFVDVDQGRPESSICRVRGEVPHFTRGAYVGETEKNDVLVFACRSNGLAGLVRSVGGQAGRMFDYPLTGCDVIDVSSIARSEWPFAIAAVVSDGTILLSRNILQSPLRRLSLFDSPIDARSIVCVDGHLFMLTSRSIITVPEFASRFLADELLEEPFTISETPGLFDFLGRGDERHAVVLQDGRAVLLDIASLVHPTSSEESSEGQADTKTAFWTDVPRYFSDPLEGPRSREFAKVA